jgi:hypothetical protein
VPSSDEGEHVPDDEPAADDPGTPDDAAMVAELLGRVPGGAYQVVVRTGLGTPVVIRNAPLMDDGRPMPTRFWLLDRELNRRIGTLEATGGVRQAEADVDPEELATAHARYAAERDAEIPLSWTGPRPFGGVGGTRRGVKCLHTHYAWYLAGGDDPVGRWTDQHLPDDARPRGLIVTPGPTPAPNPPTSGDDT